MNEKFKWLYTHVAWFVAAIIVLIDPKHIYEWAHQHEVWGGVIAALFTVVLAWAQKNKPQPPGPLTPPPSSPSQTRALHMIALFFLIALPLATASCAPTSGAHVHKFRLRRVEFVKCTVVGEKADTHFAEESLQVCRDAFGVQHAQ